MNHLYYRTRGNSDPHGKPRVFFASHPEEFEQFFNSTVELLHKFNNCAVWYEAEGELLTEEELLSHLGEMQLVVIPVTTRLLTRPNRAMEVVYPYAMERHIPVLPLMMETGLDDVFQKQFGDLQYLSPVVSDPTAIPFEEKLEKYLSGALVGDEMAAKVRAAFDAYIFLSYRKKDRKYAQELMRMIHHSPKYRDIAIWYDEYLVPGENFNEAISAALNKSDLFALVVTPSLLEKPNYVMTEEYPRAREADKPILPVEMQPTDPEQLVEHYEGLTGCVPGQENEAWEQTLLDALHRVALAENDDDPQHNFLIGLAYLDGIDVEVDFQRAVQLITGAAERSLEEAIRQLVSMYETGKGVERNYHTGVKWREKLAALLRELYRESGSEDDYTSLFNALWDLGDAIWDLGQPEQARVIYEEMRELAGSLPFQSSRRDLAVSYNRLGDIAKAQGQLAEAQRYYEQGLAISEQLAEETKTLDARRDLSVSYTRLGDIARAHGRLAEAQQYYEQALHISKQLAQETGIVEDCLELAIDYARLGHIAFEQGLLTEAHRNYMESHTILQQLCEETGEVMVQRNLSNSFDNWGKLVEEHGRLSEAQQYYEQALTISEKLAAETGTIRAQRDLSTRYIRLGQIAERQGKISEAQQYYEQVLRINEQLARETKTVDARSELATSYGRLGTIALPQGRLVEAQQYYEQALSIRKQLAEETGTVEAYICLSNSFDSMGRIAQAQERLTDAQQHYKQALKYCMQLVERTEILEVRTNLAYYYDELGNIAQMQKQFENAQEYYEQGFNIRRKLAETTETVYAQRDLSKSYDNMGDIAFAQGQLAEAQRYFEQGLSIRERLAEELRTVEARYELSFSYDRIGLVAKEQHRLAEAKRYFEQSLSIRERLVEETDVVPIHDTLAICYYFLGMVGDTKKYYYTKAYEIWSSLSKQCPNDSRLAQRRDMVKELLD